MKKMKRKNIKKKEKTTRKIAIFQKMKNCNVPRVFSFFLFIIFFIFYHLIKKLLKNDKKQ